jgi:hypothetical protein
VTDLQAQGQRYQMMSLKLGTLGWICGAVFSFFGIF